MSSLQIRVLTVRQPWAWAIINAGKDIENRSRPTKYRGTLAIHAGLRPDAEGFAHLHGLGIGCPDLVTGAILGLVDVVGCDQAGIGDWAIPGMWHWRLRNPRPIAPIPCRGQLGLFVAPASVADHLMHTAGQLSEF